MQGGEAKERRLLRLGQSSLVVSLPKRWIEKVGLKPGDVVLVFPEGESLRIKPATRKENLDMRVGGREAAGRYVLPCAYVLGYERVLFEEGALSEELKRKIERLPGVIVSEDEEGRVEVKVALDLSKINLRDLLGKAASLSSQIALLLSRALEGSADMRELEEMSSQAYALRTLSERFLYAQLAGERSSVSFLSLSILTLFWLVDRILLDVTEEAVAGGLTNTELAKVALRLADLAPLVVSSVPSSKKAEELAVITQEVERELREEGRDPIAARLLDVVRLYQIMGHSMVCVSMAEERVE